MEKGAGGAQLLGRVTAPRRICKKQRTLSRETAIQQVGIGNAFRFLRRGLPIWKFGVGGNVSPPALSSGNVQQAEGKSGRKTEPCPFTFLLWNSFKKGAGVLFISLGYCSLGAWSESAIAAVGRLVLQRVPTLYTSVSPQSAWRKLLPECQVPPGTPGWTAAWHRHRQGCGRRWPCSPACPRRCPADPRTSVGQLQQPEPRHETSLDIYWRCTGHRTTNCQGARD